MYAYMCTEENWKYVCKLMVIVSEQRLDRMGISRTFITQLCIFSMFFDYFCKQKEKTGHFHEEGSGIRLNKRKSKLLRKIPSQSYSLYSCLELDRNEVMNIVSIILVDCLLQLLLVITVPLASDFFQICAIRITNNCQMKRTPNMLFPTGYWTF